MHARKIFTLLICFVLLLFKVQAQNFTRGNIVVTRVGDGTASLTSGNTVPVSLLEFNTTSSGTSLGAAPQSPIRTFNVSGGSGKSLTLSGNGIGEGFLSLSQNGKYLSFGGYNVATGADATNYCLTGVSNTNNGIMKITVTNGGSGYTSAPTVVFTGGGFTTVAAAKAVITGGVVTYIYVTTTGAGYTSSPTISFTGGVGTGAAATVDAARTSQGSGYTTAPTCTISAPDITGGVTATVGCQVAAGAITNIYLSTNGTGYTKQPTATFTGVGTGANQCVIVNPAFPYWQGSSVAKVIGRVDYLGNIDYSTSITNNTASTGTPNSVKMVTSVDGSAYWINNNGLMYATHGATGLGNNSTGATAAGAGVLINSGANTGIHIFKDQLYTTGSYGNIASYNAVGVALPTTSAGATVVNLVTQSAYGFQSMVLFDLNPSVSWNNTGYDVMYLADKTYGLAKYYYSGTAWVAINSQALTNAIFTGASLSTIIGTLNTSGQPVIYGIVGDRASGTGNGLVSITDKVAYNTAMATSTSDIAYLAKAGTNYGFRGLAFAPSTVATASTITAVTGSNGLLSVDFTAPSTNGGAAITDYKYSLDNGVTYTAAGSTASPIVISGLTNGTLYPVQLIAVNAQGNSVASNSLSGTPANAVLPSLLIDASTTAAFSAIYGTASAVQSFVVSGANLSTDITATAPTGFELSSDGITYGSTATFLQSGNIASGTLSVRLMATATAGAYNAQTISIKSTGAISLALITPSTGCAVAKKALTAPISVAPKVYDGLSGAVAVTMGAVSGYVGTDTLQIAASGIYYSKGAGTRSVDVNYILSNGTGLASNYSMATSYTTISITQKYLTAATTVASRVYDGTKTAGAVTLGAVTGLVGTQSINITATARDYDTSSIGSKYTSITYTLTSGATDSASNYKMNGLGVNGLVTAKPILITPNADQSKPYGTADPVLTYTASPALVSTDVFTGAIGRAAGEIIGARAFTLGNLSAGNNYTLTLNGTNSFTIIAPLVPVPYLVSGATATAAFTSVYGTTSAAQTFSVSGTDLTSDITATAPTGFELSADGITYGPTAIFTANAGAASGTLSVRLSAAAAAGTYNSKAISITSDSAITLTINTPSTGNTVAKKALTATVSVAPKVYDGLAGAVTVNLGAVTGYVGSDTLNITTSGIFYTKGAGLRNVSVTYTLANGTGLASNYSMAASITTITVTPKVLTAATTVASKVYDGTKTPGAVTRGAITGLVGSESINITATARDYDTVSTGSKYTSITYTLTNGTNDSAYNYKMNNLGVNGLVTAMPITITATADQSKHMGQDDPTFTYTASPSLLLNGVFTGALGRASGETMGAYAFTLGNLKAANYSLTLGGSNSFTILAPLCTVPTVTAAPAATQTLCKNAGASDLTVSATGTGLTYQWYVSTSNSNSGGNSISDATSTTYAPSTSVAGTAYYYCVVTGTCGTESSTTAEVVVNAPTNSSSAVTACTSYSWNGNVYTASGAYTFNTTNSLGCDSVATLNLTITLPTASSNSLAICANQLPYAWNGVTFTGAGTQTAHINNAEGCDSAATLVLTIIPFSVTEISGPISNCAAATGTYSVSAVNGAAYVWSVPTGITITTGVGTNSIEVAYGKTFVADGTISAKVTSTCGVNITRSFTVLFSKTIPKAPSTLFPAAICGPGAATVSVTATVGTVTDWYNAATAGNLVLSGSDSYTLSSVSTGASYYAASRIAATGCTSATRSKAVTITVNEVPSLLVTTGVAICGPGKASISAAIATGGTIDWYADAIGGTAVAAAKPILAIPTIANTLTYYATSKIIKTGCFSARAAAVVTVNPVPSAPTAGNNSICLGQGKVALSATLTQGDTLNWYAAAKAGAALQANSASFTTPSIAKTTVYYAEAKTAAGCVSPRTAVTATVNLLPKEPAKFVAAVKCGPSTVTVSATALPLTTIDWYFGATGGSALQSGADAYTTAQTIDASTNFYAQSRFITTGCVSAVRKAVPVTINAVPAAPAVIGNAGLICGTGKASISATIETGGTIDWYSDATGGTAIAATKPVLAIASISATTNYYATSRIIKTTCFSESRTLVTVVVNPLPAVPNGFGASRCGVGIISLSATPVGNDVISWFAAATKGTALVTGSTTYAPSISKATTFYAESKSAAGCYSASRAPVVASIACGGRNLAIDNNAQALKSTTTAKLYPNPNHGAFTISINTAQKAGYAKIQILGISGNLLMEVKAAVNSNGTVLAPISIKGMAAGIYQARYIIGKETGNVRMVIAQ